ncbi:hypothetical protein HanRHA438_Chr09g0395361 [Helianthus annuus]|nr:hypothetical protein HanOQP8_Chr09g0320811 [Helianthus annuus]KAJ0887832.1 hypothetical protein HanRHA438_Chr09g0395361 [Helianthus annuus]
MLSMDSAPYPPLRILQTHHGHRCASSKPTMATVAHPPNPPWPPLHILQTLDLIPKYSRLLLWTWAYGSKNVIFVSVAPDLGLWFKE